MPAASSAGSTTILFAPGTYTLDAAAEAAIKAFAAQRGSATISIIGHGDATSSTPAAQTAALGLALSRAEAVAVALKADGVPPAATRVSADAAGQGVSLSLVK